MSLSQERPPLSIDEDLGEYLNRRFIDIGTLMDQAPKFPERKQMPYKPQFGDIHYFGDPATHNYIADILRDGWWGFVEIIPSTVPKTGKWTRLNVVDEAVNLFVEAGYGGIIQSVPVGISNINGTPQILPADTIVIAIPRNITQNIANDGLQINNAGIWLLSLSIALSFSDVNSGRRFDTQLWNQTQGALDRSTPVFVGRNQDGITFSVSIIFETDLANEGDLFVIRLVSTADTFSAVILEGFSFSVSHTSNAQNL